MLQFSLFIDSNTQKREEKCVNHSERILYVGLDSKKEISIYFFRGNNVIK